MSLKFLINSLEGGGAEAALVRLLPFLNVEKVFLLEKGVKFEVSKEEIFILSEHTIKTNSLYKTLFIPVYSWRLASQLKNKDTVISFLERANFVNIVSNLFKKHKTVISVRMNQLEGHRGFGVVNKFLVRILYPKADTVVAVSQGVKNSLIKLGVPEEKIKIIYNPYPIHLIQNLSEEPVEGIFEGAPFIITVGRLTKPKGQWYLLRIFRELKKKFPELKLLLLGDGELKDYLVKLSENLGLRTYLWDRDKLSGDFDVYFLGFKKNPFKYISRSKLFVFPSLWEGFPNALVEAMACGIPVVSADCRSGPREILSPDTDFNYQTKEPEFAEYGVLMPPFDVEFKKANKPLEKRERIWVEVLGKLLQDEELRKKYSKKALERARDFDVENIVKDWEKLLREV
ncbi:Glycosyltransferase involved in cell wall bisynthesis [Balnearium lithotrophicum]|uniref:Glycosyltransferase involved in cell wall bisynthesis n=1 Tax=Balnearium lithotrophicum TaxID=223788 RepID=A0A521C723_9BACT|nr:glycosyltransferase [Balnearium lithotrophicum]SMO55218.1 Glycosyltransferase involved in cell wall bisynthesis [Balnearium lithotrophicum]